MKNLLIIPFLILSLNCFAPGYLEIYIPDAEPIRKVYTLAEKLQAIIHTETSNGTDRYNPNEIEAVGILQIWEIMVKECNRIVGYEKYQLSDRNSDKLSIDMFMTYETYWNPSMDFEAMARTWNAGPRGMQKDCSLKYYERALTNLYKS